MDEELLMKPQVVELATQIYVDLVNDAVDLTEKSVTMKASAENLAVSVNGFYSLQVTRKGCKSQLSAPISFVRTAILQLAANQRLDVSPNPTNTILRLYTEGVENGTIEVRDVLGRLVVQIPTHTGEDILSVADWQTGVYFVHLKTEKGATLAMRRVVKF